MTQTTPIPTYLLGVDYRDAWNEYVVARGNIHTRLIREGAEVEDLGSDPTRVNLFYDNSSKICAVILG